MRRHPIDAFSLVTGLIVTGVAVTALVRPWRLDVGTWVGPTLLIAAGVVILGLVAIGSVGRRSEPAGVAGPIGADAPIADTVDGAGDPERADALAAAYDELDDDMTVRVDRTSGDEPAGG